MTFKQLLSYPLGNSLESLVRSLVPLVVLTYCAGESLGRYIHSLSESLAQFHSQLFYPSPQTTAPPTPIATEPPKPKRKTTRKKPTAKSSETLSKPKAPRRARRRTTKTALANP